MCVLTINFNCKIFTLTEHLFNMENKKKHVHDIYIYL